MRKKLTQEEKKVRTTITLSRNLDKIVGELMPNKSKYIEWLIYQNLSKNNQLPKDFIL